MTDWQYRGGEREVDWVVEAWRAGRPVVLTGPAGIGKTSLAREAARRTGAEIVWVVGTASTRDTPLGALTATARISRCPAAAAVKIATRSPQTVRP